MSTMSVVNNLPAMFTNRQLNINEKVKAKSTEKLSSGYRINRAADDAAGLAISEKLRRQIRGLGKATENICDGISFVQTGDGYLNEVHDMIQRVNELAIQSANGTNSTQDRLYIDQEVQQLKAEMKRIYDTAEFNEILIFKMPYAPQPEIDETVKMGYRKISSQLPDGVTMDAASAANGYMSSSYTGTDGTEYHAATYFDFSGINLSNLGALNGKGFYSTCCTCDDHYSITFDASTENNSVRGSSHFTYTVGVLGCTSAADVVDRIVQATGGCPNNHFTNYEVDSSNPNRLVVYDNRPYMTASSVNGLVGAGVTVEQRVYPGEGDIQVFNAGLASGGQTVWGGVEINNVRHTWDELGIELSEDGRTFKKNQEISFTDYTGERVVLNVREGDELPQMSRNYKWTADSSGIYVNNVFAETWEEIGINTSGGNNGEYSFHFRNMKVSFEVNDGDTLDAIIDGINGNHNSVTDSSWDIAVSYTETEKALQSYTPCTIKVTDANKGLMELDYYVKADTNGVSIYDGDGVTGAHTVMQWGNTSNDFQDHIAFTYPISDWGLGDTDGMDTASNLVTFDDQAIYTYRDQSNADMPMEFSFTLQDETSLTAAIAALNGAALVGNVYAPGELTVSAADTKAPTVDVVKSLDYATQVAQGRDFNDPDAILTGDITRQLIKGAEISSSDATANSISSETGTGVTQSGIERYVYDQTASDAAGTAIYRKVTLDTEIYHRIYEQDLISTKQYQANYQYTGSFAGQSMNPVDGNTFTLREVTTTHQTKTDEITRITNYTVDTGTAYTAADAATGGVINQSQLQINAILSTVSDPAGWTNAAPGSTVSTGANFDDEVKVTNANGDAFVVKYHNKANYTKDHSQDILFQAAGNAYKTFELKENTANNRSESARFADLTVHVPKHKLWIHSGVEAGDGILLEWDSLSNSVTGMASVNLQTEQGANLAIGHAKKALQVISRVRSDFGAYQNRLEHSKNINENTAENTTAAESVIRDTDMAKEMVRLSMLNILSQAGSSMLAQANQTNQGVLNLLQ